MIAEKETRYFVDLALPYSAKVFTHVLIVESRHPIAHSVIVALHEADPVSASLQTMQEYRKDRDV